MGLSVLCGAMSRLSLFEFALRLFELKFENTEFNTLPTYSLTLQCLMQRRTAQEPLIFMRCNPHFSECPREVYC